MQIAITPEMIKRGVRFLDESGFIGENGMGRVNGALVREMLKAILYDEWEGD